jgi:hypothetical protein
MAQFLVESDPTQGQPLGVSASPVHILHARVRGVLLNRLGPQHAELFAMPLAGADGRISWSTELQGVAQRASALPEPERARLLQRHGRLVADIRTLAGTMAGEGPSSMLVSQVLHHSVRTPPGDWLFSVGGQPVMTLWGHAAPGEVPAEAPAQPAALIASQALAAGPIRADSTREPGPQDRRPAFNPWWLLPVLAALPLIALAWWLLRHEAESLPAPGLQAQIDTARQTNAELARLLEERQRPSLQCTPDPVQRETPPDPNRAVSSRTEGRRATDPLRLPPGALEKGDLSFLAGLWQVGDDRVEVYRSSDPLRTTTGSERTVFEFDAQGGGRMHSVERMRHGPLETRGPAVPDIATPARVQTDGKSLQIIVESPLGATRFECVPSLSGDAECTIVNRDGHRWEAPLRRIR